MFPDEIKMKKRGSECRSTNNFTVAQLLGHSCLNIYSAYAQIYPETTYLHAIRVYVYMYILDVVGKSSRQSMLSYPAE